MPPRGWYARYAEILAEFGYSRSADAAAARRLARILGGRSALGDLRAALGSRDVLALGSGPSLGRALDAVSGLAGFARIVADSAVSELVRRRMRIDVVVTDLDGDQDSLLRAAESGAIMVVHAHADNADRLGLAARFPRVVGTAQGRPPRGLYNFGGFTDGDRCVFAAAAMRARTITLLGMDFGARVGRHSATAGHERATKIRKLRRARALLEWGAPAMSGSSRLYAASGRLEGFERVRPADLARVRRTA